MKYVLGNGKVAIAMGNLMELDIPYVKLSILENQQKIGADLLESNELEHSETMIVFKNLEGLKVLENLIKKAKKELVKQNKAIK